MLNNTSGGRGLVTPTSSACAIRCWLQLRTKLAGASRQIALRESLRRAGKIDHDHLFFKETGEPIRNLQYAHLRWRRTLARLPEIRYSEPYCARHSLRELEFR